jgi:hypothetical protein
MAGNTISAGVAFADPVLVNATFTPVTVAQLPAAASSQGMRMVVNDSNAAYTAGIGATVAAGGAFVVPVFCNGTNWLIG